MKKFILNYETFDINDYVKLEMLKKIYESFNILLDGRMNQKKIDQRKKYLDNIFFDITKIYLDMVNDGLIETDNKHVHDINLVGRMYGSLTEEEKKSLGDPDIWKDGNALHHLQNGEDVLVDFENGLSVAGKLVVDGKDLGLEIDDEAVIYDSANPELLETETKKLRR